ncbi:hypothetical protein NNJEOMEG_01240 [Fundidesulfovibrio magnetotacticus]|uniref:HDOD domain-containing protein n=1 Tax=Fundidesulfovibrio magnetotacticus TaxID=2730080 RepID=A0A6V8LSX1_9BACT|nr:HDOD domain-containing protein [Fundidesulfovibrio magnetotacticus]GFK93408.1 hypothetical protein NNJEOMEG_01240 [Fundidesulfovibrio magnetotacticus]
MRVSDLRPGLVLSQPVRDVNGRLLMGSGMRLSDRAISVLKSWGVAAVAVQGERQPSLADAGDNIPEELAARAQDLAAGRLARNDLTHPFVQDVFRLCVPRIARMLEEGREVLRLPDDLPAERPGADLPPLDVQALVGCNRSLGAMPEVLAALSRAMDDPGTSPATAAAIIQTDPGLAARLLKLVNSALYGFPQRIDTITRAVTVIGVQQLSALALGMSVMDLFSHVPQDILDVRQFWRHSLACACAARALASALGMPNTERFFVAGLLHDVGLLLFIQCEPDRVRRALQEVRSVGASLVAAERKALGADHCQAGAALLSGWKLPPGLVEAARCHHEPSLCADERDAAIVHAADFLAEALALGSSGQSVLMPLDTAAFDRLGAPPGVADAVLTRVEDQFVQLEAIFLNGHGTS